MNDRLTLPQMRPDLLQTLESLSDPTAQAIWGTVGDDGSFENLDLCVMILEDSQIIPDPTKAVGVIIYPDELVVIEPVATLMAALLVDHGSAPDSEYLNDPRWGTLVEASRFALERMSTP
jgi:hypothetical protein